VKLTRPGSAAERESSASAPSVRALCAAVTPRLVRRSLLTAVLVGGILFAVNSAEAVGQLGFTGALTLKLVVTMLIPFVVSLASAAAARLEMRAARDAGAGCAVGDAARQRPPTP